MPDAPEQATTRPGLTCISCGYDLSGLPVDNPCPECGTPIEQSRLGPLLRYVEPGVLRAALRSTRALRLALTAAASVLLLFLCTILGIMVAGILLDVVFGNRAFLDFLEPIASAFSVLCLIAFVLSAVSYAVGLFMLTSPQLRAPFERALPAASSRYALLLFIPTAPLAMMVDPVPGARLVLVHTLGVLASASLYLHYRCTRQTMMALARRCATNPKIAPAGAGSYIGLVILLGAEFGSGWRSSLPLVVAFFLFLALEHPIRELRKAVLAEARNANHAHTSGAPPSDPRG